MTFPKTPFPGKDIHDSGFTLIEVLIAIAIFSIGFLAVGAMQLNALSNTTGARRTTEAMTLAETQVERLRSLPFYADDNGVNDDGIGGIDDHDVLPDLKAGTKNAPADATPFTVRWTVTNNQPLDPYPAGLFTTAGALTRSKTIRVWVTPDNDAANVITEIEFAKYWVLDK